MAGNDLLAHALGGGAFNPAVGLAPAIAELALGRSPTSLAWIYAVGPLLKERLWETTAVRELRVQTLELARRLMASH